MEAFVVSADATRRSLVKHTVGGSDRRAWVLTKLMKWMVDANTDKLLTPHEMSSWTAQKRIMDVPDFTVIGRNSLGGAWGAEDLDENDTVVAQDRVSNSPSAPDAASVGSRAKSLYQNLDAKLDSQQKEKESTTTATQPDMQRMKLTFTAPDALAGAGLAEQQQQQQQQSMETTQQSMETTQQSMESLPMTAASPGNWSRNLDRYGCADFVDTNTAEYWAAFDEGVKM
jgi:hypothetical protein